MRSMDFLVSNRKDAAAEGLVQDNTDSRGKIERTDGAGHGYAIVDVRVAGQDIQGQSFGFRAEYKEHAATKSGKRVAAAEKSKKAEKAVSKEGNKAATKKRFVDY